MTTKFTDDLERAVFLPFCGEFGHLILQHVRYVHGHRAGRKVVLCEKGQECLFPTADSFRYDWVNPIPDRERCSAGAIRDVSNDAYATYDEVLRRRLEKEYPDHEVIRPGRRGAPGYDWNAAESNKFLPSAAARLPIVDIALAPRWRMFEVVRNNTHYPHIVKSLRAMGITVGLVGAAETSVQCAADTRAWDHPDGATAGTVDLLSRCILYVGTDSGVSHLAGLMDIPTLLFRKTYPGNTDLTGAVRRANRAWCKILGDSAWEDPEEILYEILLFLHAWEIKQY